jgi:uncharacterized protein YbaP (TraB family)
MVAKKKAKEKSADKVVVEITETSADLPSVMTTSEMLTLSPEQQQAFRQSGGTSTEG